MNPLVVINEPPINSTNMVLCVEVIVLFGLLEPHTFDKSGYAAVGPSYTWNLWNLISGKNRKKANLP